MLPHLARATKTPTAPDAPAQAEWPATCWLEAGLAERMHDPEVAACADRILQLKDGGLAPALPL